MRLVSRNGYIYPFLLLLLLLLPFLFFPFLFLLLFVLLVCFVVFFPFLHIGYALFSCLSVSFFCLSWAFDETFGYDHDWVVGETGYVCDWTGVEEYSNDMPHCVMGICGGHKEYDLLPFSVKVKTSRGGGEAGWVERAIYP